MSSNRRILVTGGTGYQGTRVVPQLAEQWPVTVYCSMAFGNAIADTPNVRFVKGDMRDAERLRVAMAGVTDIIHLAGIVTDELVDMNPHLAFEINGKGTEQLCEIAKSKDVKRLIYASSSSVYGTQDVVCTEKTVPKPMTAYASLKLEGEKIINRYSDYMTICHIRSATCCGPAPRMRLDTIVNIFSAQAYFTGRINVNDGTQYRSNVHVADIADLYIWCLEQPHLAIHKRIFNAVESFDSALGLAEMVRSTAAETLGRQIDIAVDRNKLDARQYRMSAASVKAAGFVFKRTVKDAVLDNLAFFKRGGIKDWQSDLYFNTRRMSATMKGV